jgi:hypothetical protein
MRLEIVFQKSKYVYVCLKIEHMLVRIWTSKYEIHLFLVEVIEVSKSWNGEHLCDVFHIGRKRCLLNSRRRHDSSIHISWLQFDMIVGAWHCPSFWRIVNLMSIDYHHGLVFTSLNSIVIPHRKVNMQLNVIVFLHKYLVQCPPIIMNSSVQCFGACIGSLTSLKDKVPTHTYYFHDMFVLSLYLLVKLDVQWASRWCSSWWPCKLFEV